MAQQKQPKKNNQTRRRNTASSTQSKSSEPEYRPVDADALRRKPIPEKTVRVYCRLIAVTTDDDLVDIEESFHLHGALRPEFLNRTPGQFREILESSVILPAEVMMNGYFRELQKALRLTAKEESERFDTPLSGGLLPPPIPSPDDLDVEATEGESEDGEDEEADS